MDRMTLPTLTATARGSFRREYDGTPSETSTGVPLWTVVLAMESEDRFRPIPLRVDADVMVAAERDPRIQDGQLVELSQVTVRAAKRKTGEAYLALSADSIKVVTE